MSMTREEAIKSLQNIVEYWTYKPTEVEAAKMAIDALRPVSREQVEKAWPGCDFCKVELDDYPYIVAHSDYSSSDTCYEPSFCPICGKPLTDEAVDMVMERMEKLKNEIG